ncbi:3-hydroxyisobutyryl-CoA hydrolase [Acrasis kona]|uniref:3-hydroxyisobutyryl-CoA hydrolase n=1 Tax=Acrasis kona TaxID=1008807 RepID=A0AAW2YYP2_9EUKA
MLLNRTSRNCRLLPTIRGFSGCSKRTMEYDPDDVQFEERGSVQFITLNRPSQLNALNQSMVKKLTPNFRRHLMTEDQKVKTFVMKGAGEKAFCAGGDIKAIVSSKDTTFFKEEYELNHLIGTMKKPHVAIIDGITMGGGVGLSIHGSIRVATENTVFAMPETAIGFFTDVGGSYFLHRLPRNIGTYLALTGARLKGKQLFAAGIATHYVERASIPKLEELIVSTDTDDASVLSKAITDAFPVESEPEQLLTELVPDIDKIDKVFQLGSMKEIMQTLEEMDQEDEWVSKTLNTLKSVSPLSLRVVHRQINLGRNLSFKDCFVMELGIATQMLKENDFYEGVRALLIDKDKNPKWEPKTLDLVKRERVDPYFQSITKKDYREGEEDA